MGETILEIKDLTVYYETELETVKAINGINLEVESAKTLGLVGETGAGKTTTALSIMRLLPERIGAYKSGEILFKGRNILDIPEKEMRHIASLIPGAELQILKGEDHGSYIVHSTKIAGLIRDFARGTGEG